MKAKMQSVLTHTQIPGLAENRPSVLRGDKLYATPVPGDGHKYQGIVHQVAQTEVKLGFFKK